MRNTYDFPDFVDDSFILSYLLPGIKLYVEKSSFRVISVSVSICFYLNYVSIFQNFFLKNLDYVPELVLTPKTLHISLVSELKLEFSSDLDEKHFR